MGEWSDYFEDFPEEDPANRPRDDVGDALRARVAREARYSPELLAKMAEKRRLKLAQAAKSGRPAPDASLTKE
jgi:hypothetical protein